MTYLRATKKVLARLPKPSAGVPTVDAEPNALGDWYVNRVNVGRQPLLVLVSSTSLLPIVTPARDVRSLPGRLAGLVDVRLEELGVEPELVAREVQAMEPVRVEPTRDRSVLGILTEFCRMLPYYLASDGSTEGDLSRIAARLGETPCHASRKFDEVVWPNAKAVEVLRERWRAE